MLSSSNDLSNISIRAPARGATYSDRYSSVLKKISIRAPARGATQALLCKPCCHHISIRAPARGATLSSRRHNPGCIFQSALPRGERPYTKTQLRGKCDFNPRSREGSDSTWILSWSCVLDFNPRSREGSDQPLGQLFKCLGISIRAPARGATQATVYSSIFNPISIRAPARGATQHFHLVALSKKFQSALPRGERPVNYKFCNRI